ncbi:hypothetical protein DSCO28_35360 [Desulfosarcina ovata subsp. sediminis]|uniref:Periplasmic heavy metal sensor n=1 Tax=Desulfosarcina ovata subsp. sediminis TaxID=885957 RepID=A0A5K7ZRX7_9BACT|nr:Spy/CpxP family protein refolding chaperone [Desulfosarcina ovata]BBO82970.1 hypothetical protein DSCO28_35360 [Desulfosarcina ovata subsp. sediminis]
MRKKVILTIICSMILIGSGMTVQAGEPGAPMGKAGDGPQGPQMDRPGKACPAPAPGLDILERLDLSEAQWKSVKKLIDGDRKAAARQHDKMRDVQRRLRLAMKPQQFNEKALRGLLSEKSAIEADLMVDRAKTMNRVYNLLTAEQQELFDLAAKLKMLRGPGPDHGKQPPFGRPGQPDGPMSMKPMGDRPAD